MSYIFGGGKVAQTDYNLFYLFHFNELPGYYFNYFKKFIPELCISHKSSVKSMLQKTILSFDDKLLEPSWKAVYLEISK